MPDFSSVGRERFFAHVWPQGCTRPEPLHGVCRTLQIWPPGARPMTSLVMTGWAAPLTCGEAWVGEGHDGQLSPGQRRTQAPAPPDCRPSCSGPAGSQSLSHQGPAGLRPCWGTAVLGPHQLPRALALLARVCSQPGGLGGGLTILAFDLK